MFVGVNKPTFHGFIVAPSTTSVCSVAEGCPRVCCGRLVRCVRCRDHSRRRNFRRHIRSNAQLQAMSIERSQRESRRKALERRNLVRSSSRGHNTRNRRANPSMSKYSPIYILGRFLGGRHWIIALCTQLCSQLSINMICNSLSAPSINIDGPIQLLLKTPVVQMGNVLATTKVNSYFKTVLCTELVLRCDNRSLVARIIGPFVIHESSRDTNRGFASDLSF